MYFTESERMVIVNTALSYSGRGSYCNYLQDITRLGIVINLDTVVNPQPTVNTGDICQVRLHKKGKYTIMK